jgi:glycosyltransferase involved in cell wall biosynthesis
LSKEELGKRVKAADVFVLNTAYEGLSHQLLEVMDIGVPIVTTEVGGNPELIEKDVSGFLVPCNDVSELVESIERLLASEDLRSRFATHAKVRTKNFNKDEVVEQFVNMLDIDIWKKN